MQGGVARREIAGRQLFLQTASLIGEIGNKAAQVFRGITEIRGELIEWSQRGGNIVRRSVAHFQRMHLTQPDIAQLPRESFVLGLEVANYVDILEAGLPVEPQVF